MNEMTYDTSTTIPPISGDAWGTIDEIADLPDGDGQERNIAYTLMQEAVTRIMEPTIIRYETTLFTAWDAFCREHLPVAQYKVARQYFALTENLPMAHSRAVLAIVAAMEKGMRGGLDPTCSLEENFQRVCRAGGLDSPCTVDALMLDQLSGYDRERFTDLFPTVRLGIMEQEE